MSHRLVIALVALAAVVAGGLYLLREPSAVGRWLYVNPQIHRSTKEAYTEVVFGEDGRMHLRFTSIVPSDEGPKLDPVTLEGTWRKTGDGMLSGEAKPDGQRHEVAFEAEFTSSTLTLRFPKRRWTLASFQRFDEAAHGRAKARVADILAGRVPDAVRPRVDRSKANMQELLRRFRDVAGADGAGWDALPFSGKRFVLGLVALGQLDPSKATDRALLFSAPEAAARVKAGDYAKVTAASLQSEVFDELTSYLGHRNRNRTLKAAAGDRVLLLVDPTFADYGILLYGWSDGDVVEVSLDVLGVPYPSDSFFTFPTVDELRSVSVY